MLLAAATPGTSLIENAAAEPHIVDLAHVLAAMGAKLEGIGSNRLVIEGCKTPAGFEHSIVPDHIEAGTFAIAAACTRGHVVIQDIRRQDLKMTSHTLRRFNINMRYPDEYTWEILPSKMTSNLDKVQVGLWPAFPTDLMSSIIVLATQASGTTLCHDWMFEARMFFVDKLITMGANVTLCDPHRVLVSGPTALRGQSLSSPDIRAGIALMIAALSARGESLIDHAELVDRGYERIEERLVQLGAQISRES